MSAPSEFSIIQQYFQNLTTSSRDDVLLAIGDDCALLQCPAGQSLAVSIDTLVEGVHFFADVDAKSLGHKSLAVGLSDLAAMGARPAWFTLALSLPEINEPWLAGFSQGLAELATEHDIQLVGGDTTRGPLTISIQVHGFVQAENALKRSGARAGDKVYVTGTLGDAGAALQLQLGKLTNNHLTADDCHHFQQRLEQPIPRVAIGQTLIGLASSAIDISDGVLADLGHILEQSQVGACLDLATLPLSPMLEKMNRIDAEVLALQSGDDYELCFTVPAELTAQVEEILGDLCSQIGVITQEQGISIINGQAQLSQITGKGYDHFK